MKPGQYALPMADYHAIPAVSASLLHTLVSECPRAAWFESWLNPQRKVDDDTKASDAGSIAHEILLEGTQDCVQVFDPADYPNADGKGHAKGWTNKSIQTARDDCRTAGKIPVLKSEFVVIENMVDAAREFIESLKHSEPGIHAAFQPDGGVSETSCIWDDHGTLCRIRPDRMSNDRKWIIDPKTTGLAAEPGAWSRKQMGALGHWARAAFYRRGCRLMFGTEPEYRFLVIEQRAPHLCSLVGVDPAGFDYGATQIERALRTWRECVDRNYFPGYPNRTVFPEVMPWDLASEQEAQGADEHGIPYDPEKLWAA